MRTSTIDTLDTDPAVQSARQQHHDARQRLQEAETARARLAPEVGRVLFELDLLQATHVVKQAEAVVREATRQAGAAEEAARARIIAGRQPGRVERLKHLLTAAAAAREAAQALLDYDSETAGRVGLVPGAHPLPNLLGLDLDSLQREIAGPVEPARPSPVPAGKQRVRVVEPFRDRDGLRRERGVEVVDAEDAGVAITKGWAVRV